MKKQSDSENQAWTISGLIKWTSDYFESRGIDSPRMTAELLLSHSLSLSRLDLYLQHDKPLLPEELSHYKSLIKRRADREPVAYITGMKGFWSLDLAVSENVLVPRPDTECLVETALDIIKKENGPLLIADLGTGSGAIILSLAVEMPGNRYVAVDLSPDAIRMAKRNAKTNCPDADVFFLAGDWLSPFSDKAVFDMIVSNPPYIPTEDIPGLAPEITRYEPLLALDGDRDGLKCIRHIIDVAHRYLKPGGWLMIETGFDQKESVVEIARSSGFYSQVEYVKDFAGNNRVVKMKKD